MNNFLKIITLVWLFSGITINAFSSEVLANSKADNSADLSVKSKYRYEKINGNLTIKRVDSASQKRTEEVEKRTAVSKRVRLAKSIEAPSQKKQQLSFKKGASFKTSLISWCEAAAAQCVWDAKKDFPFQADLTYEAESHLDIMELLAKDLYLNNINLKVVYYKTNKIFRVIDGN